MAKKATIGDSPKDRSMNIIDKFIKREERKNRHKEILPARRKAKDVPIDLWPLKDQIEYWENQTDEQKFNRKYKSYIDWLDTVKDLTGYPDRSFMDMVTPKNNKERIRELYSQKVLPKDAYQKLIKEGILWV
jgi:hypothetical protein|tara:strand:+ start:187 stop:582 length:396 start_codon:yes stop_codon:yes gene_type:complete